jgi:hypothetical protein
MITLLFDARDILLKTLELHSFNLDSKVLRFAKAGTGWLIKGFAFYVLATQERGRVVRWIFFETRKFDTGALSYNLFLERHSGIEEQPHSVYFLDKFIQPTHLYLHSNRHDYPKTAAKENITSSKHWKQTVVTYEALRQPRFAPGFL